MAGSMGGGGHHQLHDDGEPIDQPHGRRDPNEGRRFVMNIWSAHWPKFI